MIYEWDEQKNQKNYRKHRRFIRIGHSAAQKILVVVFYERYSGKSIRIISARKATSLEKGFYEKRV